MFKQTSKWSN